MKLRGDFGVANSSPSLVGRALAMLVLFVGFYLLALAIAAVLIAAPVLELVLVNRLHPQLLLASVAGLGILWALVPRRREAWVDPGPRFTAETQPDLTALVHHVATTAGQHMPSALYLIDDMNAFVTTREGFLGMGATRVLAVGVPLLAVLDRAELESVLAHEFGHFHGGDTRLLPLVYRTRGVMERTLATAPPGWPVSCPPGSSRPRRRSLRRALARVRCRRAPRAARVSPSCLPAMVRRCCGTGRCRPVRVCVRSANW